MNIRQRRNKRRKLQRQLRKVKNCIASNMYYNGIAVDHYINKKQSILIAIEELK